MNRQKFEKKLGFSFGFGIFLIILTQIIAIAYALVFGEMEAPVRLTEAERIVDRYAGVPEGRAIMETVINWVGLLQSIAISLSGWVFGLILVTLAKCSGELSFICQILNEEAGMPSSDDRTSKI